MLPRVRRGHYGTSRETAEERGKEERETGGVILAYLSYQITVATCTSIQTNATYTLKHKQTHENKT